MCVVNVVYLKQYTGFILIEDKLWRINDDVYRPRGGFNQLIIVSIYNQSYDQSCGDRGLAMLKNSD